MLHTARPDAPDRGHAHDVDGCVTTDLLLRLAGEAGYHLPTGQYL